MVLEFEIEQDRYLHWYSVRRAPVWEKVSQIGPIQLIEF